MKAIWNRFKKDWLWRALGLSLVALVYMVLSSACANTNRVGESIDAAAEASSFDSLLVYIGMFLLLLFIVAGEISKRNGSPLMFCVGYIVIASVMIWLLDMPDMLEWSLGISCVIVGYSMMKGGGSSENVYEYC